jgi:hypothetical protein
MVTDNQALVACFGRHASPRASKVTKGWLEEFRARLYSRLSRLARVGGTGVPVLRLDERSRAYWVVGTSR